MAIYVKSHRRGKSIVKAYSRERLKKVYSRISRRLDYGNPSATRRKQLHGVQQKIGYLKSYEETVRSISSREGLSRSQRSRAIRDAKNLYTRYIRSVR